MSAAALEIGYSPAAVSQQIAALETEVGTALMTRHARGVRPNAAGELLAIHARAIANQLAEAERDLERELAADNRRVRLGIFSSAAVAILPSVLSMLRPQRPRVDVEVNVLDVADTAAYLRSGELDVGIVFDHPDGSLLDRSGLAIASLGFDPLLVMLPAGNSLASDESISLRSLSEQPWVLAQGADCASIVNSACASVGFTPTVAMTTDDYAAARSAAAAGIGVAVVPGLMGYRSDRSVAIRPLTPALQRELLVATATAPRTTAVETVRRTFLAAGHTDALPHAGSARAPA